MRYCFAVVVKRFILQTALESLSEEEYDLIQHYIDEVFYMELFDSYKIGTNEYKCILYQKKADDSKNYYYYFSVIQRATDPDEVEIGGGEGY